jgi:hypothetical protein
MNAKREWLYREISNFVYEFYMETCLENGQSARSANQEATELVKERMVYLKQAWADMDNEEEPLASDSSAKPPTVYHDPLIRRLAADIHKKP